MMKLMKIKKLIRLQFKITVIDGKTKQKKIEHYILKKNEDNDFYVASKETE